MYDQQYEYSAYSNNNVMWSKYIFDTDSSDFKVYGQANSAQVYRVVFHNCDDGKDCFYDKTGSEEFDAYDFDVSGVYKPSAFYFGIDTTAKKTAVSIDGFVDTY